MIDERYLDDPARCPSCHAQLSGARETCPACGLTLSGHTAARLWQVSVQAAALLRQRVTLLETLRVPSPSDPSPPPGTYVPASPPGTYAAPPPPGTYVPTQATGATDPGPLGQLAAPRPEWTPRRVQNLLLALGVGLLGVAAVIFVVVSWGSLGVGGRAAVMTGVTALAAAAAAVTHRRGLSATAEALGLLTVGLALLDCLGAWASDLAGLRDEPGLVVAAASTALVALGAGVGARALPLRALRLSAAVLGQLPLPLLGLHLAGQTDHPAALLGATMAAQATAALAIAGAWPGGAVSRDARVVVGVGAGLAGVAATATSLVAAFAEDGSLVVGTALLLIAAAVLAVASELAHRRELAVAPVGSGAAAAVVVAASWAPVTDAVDTSRWVPVGMAAAALVLLAATALVPLDRRVGPVLAILGLTALPAAGSIPALTLLVAGRVAWLDRPWTGASGSARDVLVQADDWLLAWTGPGSLLLLIVAAAALGAPFLRRELAVLSPAGPVALTFALPLALLSSDVSYAGALAVELAAVLVVLVAGTRLLPRVPTWVDPKAPDALVWSARGAAAALLGFDVAWSFAVDRATVAVLPAAAVVLGAAVVAPALVAPTLVAPALVAPAVATRTAPAAGGRRGSPAFELTAAIAALLLLVAEAGAVTRFRDGGWPAVDAAMLTALLVVALLAMGALHRATDDRFWVTLRRVAVVVATLALVADVGAVTWWQGVEPAGAGLAAVVAAAVLVALASLDLPPGVVPERRDVLVPAGIAAALALPSTALDADRLWLALLALGAAASVVAVRGDHRIGWLAGGLLTLSTWVRLVDADVSAPEAYTVPPALALLVVGWRRRVADPDTRSWRAYGTGLLLALTPSLLRAVTDAGELRPLLLGLAALAVLAVGVVRRLQAPLVVGGTVLAIDVAVQLAPYLALVYDAVPRWVVIGAAGLLLIGAGATYERRVRDLRRVGARLASLG